MEDSFVTIKKASEILGVTPLTLRNWDKSGKFPTMRHPMNNYRVYKISDLRKIVEDMEFNKSASNKRLVVTKVHVKHLN